MRLSFPNGRLILLFVTLFLFPSLLLAEPLRESLSRVFYRIVRNTEKDVRLSQGGVLRNRLDAAAVHSSWASRRAEVPQGLLPGVHPFVSDFLSQELDPLASEIRDLLSKGKPVKEFLEARFGFELKEHEVRALTELFQLSEVERLHEYRLSTASLIERWRKRWLHPTYQRLWQNHDVLLSGEVYSGVGWISWGEKLSPRVINRASEQGSMTTTHLIVKQRQPGLFTIAHVPNTKNMNEIPTHIRIEETGELLPLMRKPNEVFEYLFVQDLWLSSEAHRYVTVVFQREQQAFSSVVIDLWTGKIFTQIPGRGGWDDVMRGPMLQLFREELLKKESLLAQVIGEELKSLGARYNRLPVERLMETNLVYQGGFYRYQLSLFDYERGVFVANPPVVTLTLRFNRLNERPIVVHRVVENLSSY